MFIYIYIYIYMWKLSMDGASIRCPFPRYSFRSPPDRVVFPPMLASTVT